MLDWLSSIKEAIQNLPELMFTHFREPMLDILEFQLSLPDRMFNALKDTFGKILTFLQFLPENIFNFFADTFNMILNLIHNAPQNVFNVFKHILEGIKMAIDTVKDVIGTVASSIYSFFEPAIENIKGFFKSVCDFWLGLGETILGAVRRVFIPDDGVIDALMAKLKEDFNGLLMSYDLKGLVKGTSKIKDIKITIMKHEATIVKGSVVNDVLGEFRGIIRGFLVLMLILFNLNQFLALIGQPAISVVNGFQALKQSGKESNNDS